MEITNMNEKANTLMHTRFRGYLPVVIDIETGGFNANTDAILEIAATLLSMDENNVISPEETISFNVEPFVGANIEPSALEFTGIDPDNPLRSAIPEEIALEEMFSRIQQEIREHHCSRAILVGHNAHFDASFLSAASIRCNIKRSPLHPFSYFDTATLAGLAYGHTVLAKACERAKIPFNNDEAHSAAYDSEKTAVLFCKIVNHWQKLGGWQWPTSPKYAEPRPL